MRLWTIAAIALWALAVGFGMERLWTYSLTPGAAATTSRDWPGASALVPVAEQPTLLMFVHPHCPCTRASLNELRKIMERTGQRPHAVVLFSRPADMPANWERTATWTMASKIPGVSVQVDTDSAEAKRFGAKTSGHVMMYDTHRQRVFSGGITAGRGHEGDNEGEHAVLTLLSGGTVERAAHPVFGCGLYEHHS